MAHLLIETATGAPTVHELNGGTITIGRTLENTIVLDDPSVSSRHAEIFREGGNWKIRDLHSSNGTAVNGQPIQEQRLQNGDVIRFATFEGQFTDESSPSTPTPVPFETEIPAEEGRASRSLSQQSWPPVEVQTKGRSLFERACGSLASFYKIERRPIVCVFVVLLFAATLLYGYHLRPVHTMDVYEWYEWHSVKREVKGPMHHPSPESVGAMNGVPAEVVAGLIDLQAIWEICLSHENSFDLSYSVHSTQYKYGERTKEWEFTFSEVPSLRKAFTKASEWVTVSRQSSLAPGTSKHLARIGEQEITFIAPDEVRIGNASLSADVVRGFLPLLEELPAMTKEGQSRVQLVKDKARKQTEDLNAAKEKREVDQARAQRILR